MLTAVIGTKTSGNRRRPSSDRACRTLTSLEQLYVVLQGLARVNLFSSEPGRFARYQSLCIMNRLCILSSAAAKSTWLGACFS